MYREAYSTRTGAFSAVLRRVAFNLLARNPRTLKLHLNGECNQSCPGCYLEAPTGPSARAEELSTSQLLRAVREVDAPGTRLDLLGGEPLLHPALDEIIAQGRQNPNIEQVFLYTNGTLIDGPRAGRLRAAGLHTALVSLHGHEPGLHDGIVARPGAWARAVEGIRALGAAGLRTYIFAVVSAPNLPYLELLDGLARRLDVGVIYFPHVARGPDDALALSGSSIRLALRWSLSRNYVHGRELREARRCGRRLCRAFTDTISVRPDGVVTPCPFLDLTLGNLKSAPLWQIIEEARHMPELRRFLALPDECRGCTLARVCGGGCKARRQTLLGDTRGRDLFCTHGPFRRPIPVDQYDSYLPLLS